MSICQLDKALHRFLQCLTEKVGSRRKLMHFPPWKKTGDSMQHTDSNAWLVQTRLLLRVLDRYQHKVLHIFIRDRILAQVCDLGFRAPVCKIKNNWGLLQCCYSPVHAMWFLYAVVPNLFVTMDQSTLDNFSRPWKYSMMVVLTNMPDSHGCPRKFFQWEENVHILLILFKLLTIQCKWTFTKSFSSP